MKNQIIRILTFVLLFVTANNIVYAQNQNKAFKLRKKIAIYIDGDFEAPLLKSVQTLQKDIEKTVDAKVVIRPIKDINESGIIITTSTNKYASKLDAWEGHRVHSTTINNNLHVVLQGANMRGTIYAIYTFSEKLLGIPPLWYYCGWQTDKKNELNIPAKLDITINAPEVKYRAIFPNDMDLLSPWRKESKENDGIWLETALRLKYNTVEWHDGDGIDIKISKEFKMSKTAKLISEYGLVNTTHHHSPLNASFRQWDEYWKDIRDTAVPQLSLANEKLIDDFWRFYIEGIKKSGVEMLWVIGFRGAGDHPFWYTFKDAPTSPSERGKVISRMIKRQRDLVIEIMGEKDLPFRTIFYDELSDLLADGYITPPNDNNLTWTYVAARRDHYPNKDVQNMQPQNGHKTGYYFNYQFTSTGSHLAPGEGPWKMEQNYRFIKDKNKAPLEFSVVNAGNIREFVMELSANAAMMWSYDTYSTDAFLTDFCKQYYGADNGKAIAKLYTDYYNAFWKQRKQDLKGIDRQYIFQDLRYKKAINEIAKAIYERVFTGNPLKDHQGEQVPGRTYNIIPADNNAITIMEALEKGTTNSAAAFEKVASASDKLANGLTGYKKTFLNDNLIAPSWFMYYLNKALYDATLAYKNQSPKERAVCLERTKVSLQKAEDILKSTLHSPFAQWYANDTIFNLNGLIAGVQKAINTSNETK